MKIKGVFRKIERTPEQKAADVEIREMFRDWKPGPEELLASGRWSGPIVVEGQQDFWKAIGRVRALREAQGLTLKDISQRCGIDVATLSKLENGKKANPTLFTMLLYVGAVGKRLHFSISERPVLAKKTLRIPEDGATPNGNGKSRKARVKVRRGS